MRLRILGLLVLLPALASAQTTGPSTPQVQHVICDSGCSGAAGGTTDTDDASIAAGQTAAVSLGLTQVYNGSVWRRLTFGQAAMASSLPVVLASDQPAIPVSGTFWQTTQPISAAALPLPTTASTSTKQSDGSQKTQIVDGAGNVIGATSNALDINIKSGNSTTLIATQATGSNLHVVVDAAPSTAITAAALPLPANAAQETGGNLATLAAKDYATAAKQDTGNTSLASITTNTTPLTVSGAGGYIRQDSTATMAKESGGNLATIAGKDFATSAKQDTENTSLATLASGVKTLGGAAAAVGSQIAGLDPVTNKVQALAVGQTGATWVNVLQTGSGLPLLPCNPVRRTNCAAKGF